MFFLKQIIEYLFDWNLNYFYCYITDPPAAPEDLANADTSKTSSVLTWQPPSNDGGAPVTGYYVEMMAPFSSRWTKVRIL